MSVGMKLSIIAVTMVLLGGAFAALPDAAPGDPTLSIPSVLYDPIVGVLHLNRYFPVGALLNVISFDLTLRSAMLGLWVTSWLWERVAK